MKKLMAWAHTPVGDTILSGVIIFAVLYVSQQLNWLLWAAGWMRCIKPKIQILQRGNNAQP